jgi:hypothetical protein
MAERSKKVSESATVAKEPDGEDDGGVSGEDEAREGVTGFFEERLGLVRADAERLEEAGEAVAQMAGEQEKPAMTMR